MLKAVLDGNCLDYFLENLDELERVKQAVADGRLTLLATHIMKDELDAITDGERWAQLEAVRGSLTFVDVPTTGFVSSTSRPEGATLMSWSEVEDFAVLTTDNPRHAEDALLVLTARTHGAVLVTLDQRLTKRAREQGVEVLAPWPFVRRVVNDDR